MLNEQQQVIGINLAVLRLRKIDFLKNLPNLTQIFLGGNFLTDISVLKVLPNLTHLNLEHNSLKDINVLRYLPKLTQLGLRVTKARDLDLSVLITLQNLTHLDLRENELIDISILKFLPSLMLLNLRENYLRDVSLLKALPNLTELDLSSNQISELPEELLDLNIPIQLGWGSVDGIYLRDNPLEEPPPEIIELGYEAIKAYFAGGERKAINEIKIILVGDGSSGKTSLSKVLRGEAFDEHENQTHGINIYKKEINGVCVNYWDFGGQEMMHSTHQFFLSSRSLYVLVLDGRKEEDAEYWLKYIESFGGDSPVLIVLNKSDEHASFDLNRKHLLEKYSNIQDFYKLSFLRKLTSIRVF